MSNSRRRQHTNTTRLERELDELDRDIAQAWGMVERAPSDYEAMRLEKKAHSLERKRREVERKLQGFA